MDYSLKKDIRIWWRFRGIKGQSYRCMDCPCSQFSTKP